MKKLFFLVVLSIICATSTASETRIRISVVDSGIAPSVHILPFLCLDGQKDFTGFGLAPGPRFEDQHGTNVSWLVAAGLDPKKVCIEEIKWFDTRSSEGDSERAFERALRYAAQTPSKYINLSAGGGGFSLYERDSVYMALKRGKRFIVAAGNNAENLSNSCNYFPCCYGGQYTPNFYTVGATDKIGKAAYFSNYGGPVNAWAPGVKVDGGSGIVMSGTSQATANFTNRLVKNEHLWSK